MVTGLVLTKHVPKSARLLANLSIAEDSRLSRSSLAVARRVGSYH